MSNNQCHLFLQNFASSWKFNLIEILFNICKLHMWINLYNHIIIIWLYFFQHFKIVSRFSDFFFISFSPCSNYITVHNMHLVRFLLFLRVLFTIFLIRTQTSSSIFIFFIFYSTTKHEIIQIKNHNLLCSLDPPNQSRLF